MATTTINGNSGNNVLIGTKGTNIIIGNAGNDILIGKNGGDTLNSGAGNDLIIAGNGDDTINGGSGSDTMLGGNGKDTFIQNISENVGSTDYIDGGNGKDTLIIQGTAQQLQMLAQAIAAFNASNKSQVFHFGNYAGGLLKLNIVNVENIQLVTIGNSAPIAVNDTASVSESTTPNAAADFIGNVLTNDHDPDATDVITVTSIAPIVGSYGTLVIQANGSYAYSFNNTTSEALAQGDVVHDIFTYTISDGHGGTSAATLNITVTGTNDAPKATVPTIAPLATTENASLNVTPNLLANITDVDAHHTLSIASVSGDSHVTLNAGVVTFNPGTDFDHLAQGDTQTVNFSYVARDEFGALTGTVNASIVVTGTNDAPVATLANISLPGVTENVAPVDLTANLLANITDKDDHHTLSIASVSGDSHITLNAGVVTFNPGSDFDHLAQGNTATVNFSYTAQDEFGAATTPLNASIVITGTNDIAVISGTELSGNVKEDVTLSASGQLGISDADTGQSSFEPSFLQGTYGDFSINASGHWNYALNNMAVFVQPLPEGEQHIETFRVYSQDHSVYQDIAVTVEGTNDTATITGTNLPTSVQEDSMLVTSGHLDVSDVDAGEAAFTPSTQTGLLGYGTFTMLANGDWDYTLDSSLPEVQAMAVGEQHVETFTVFSQDGTASQDIVVTIIGTYDLPIITASANFVTESGTPDGAQVSGNVFSSIVLDHGNSLSVTSPTEMVGLYGTLTLLADGNYTYTTYENVTAGVVVEDIFNFTTVDSQQGSVDEGVLSIYVTGANTAPASISLIGTQYMLPGFSVVANFLDPDGDVLTYGLVNPVLGLSIDMGTGEVSYNFAPGQHYAILNALAEAIDPLGAQSNAIPLGMIFDPTYYTGLILYDNPGDIELNATASNQILIGAGTNLTMMVGSGNNFIIATGVNDIASFEMLPIGISLTMDADTDGILTAIGSDASETKIVGVSSFVGGGGSNTFVHGSAASDITVTVSGTSGTVVSSDGVINDTFTNFQNFTGNAAAVDTLIISDVTAPVTFGINGTSGTIIGEGINNTFSDMKIITDDSSPGGNNALFSGASSAVTYALDGTQAVVTGGGITETLNNILIIADDNASSDLFSVGLGTWNMMGDLGLSDQLVIRDATAPVTFTLDGTSGTAIGGGHNDTFSNIQTITDNDITNDIFKVGLGSWTITGNAATNDTFALSGATAPVVFFFSGSFGTAVASDNSVNDLFINMKVITDNNADPSQDSAVFAGSTGVMTFTLNGNQMTTSGGGMVYTLNNIHTIIDNNATNDIFNVISGTWKIDPVVTHTINFTTANNNVQVILGPGDYIVHGHAGAKDIVSFADATGGVTIDLPTGSVSGGSITASMTNINTVVGTAYNDTLTASSGAQFLMGGLGTDTITGGMDGLTVASYALDASHYTVVTDGFGVITQIIKLDGSGTDTLTNISKLQFGGLSGLIVQNLVTSSASTVVGGNTLNNLILGGATNDTIIGAIQTVNTTTNTTSLSYVGSSIFTGEATEVYGTAEEVTTTAKVTTTTYGGNTIVHDSLATIPTLVGTIGTDTTTVGANTNINNTTTTYGSNTITSIGDPILIGSVNNFTLTAASTGGAFNGNAKQFGSNDTTLGVVGNTIIVGNAPGTQFGTAQNITITADTTTNNSVTTISIQNNTMTFGSNSLTAQDINNTGATNQSFRTELSSINGVNGTLVQAATAITRAVYQYSYANTIKNTLIGDIGSLSFNLIGGAVNPGTGNIAAATIGQNTFTFNANILTTDVNPTTNLRTGVGNDLLIGNIQYLTWVMAGGSITGTTVGQTTFNLVDFRANTFNFGANSLLTGDGHDVLIGNVQTLSLDITGATTSGVGTNLAQIRVGVAGANSFIFGKNILTAGNGNNLLIGNIQSLTLSEMGGTATATNADSSNGSGIDPFNSGLIAYKPTFGANTLTSGNGNNTLIGNIQTLSFDLKGGTATSAGLPGDFAGTDVQFNVSTFTFGANILTVGNGNNLLIGNIGLFKVSLTGGTNTAPNASASSAVNMGGDTFTFATNRLIAGTGTNTLVGNIDTFQATLNEGTGPAYNQREAFFPVNTFSFGFNTLTAAGPSSLYGNIRLFNVTGNGGQFGTTLFQGFNHFNFATNRLSAPSGLEVGNIGTLNISLSLSTSAVKGNIFTFGNNTLTGGSGPTTMYGNIQSITLASAGLVTENVFNLGNNTLIAGSGPTTMYASTPLNALTVAGFTVNGGINDLRAGAGAVTMIGGYGVNYADFIQATGAATATLDVTTAQTVAAGLGQVTLNTMQGLKGSDFNDVLSAGAFAGTSYLYGGKGNDILNGTTVVGAKTVFVFNGGVINYTYTLTNGGNSLIVKDTHSSNFDGIDTLNNITFGPVANASVLQFGNIYGTILYTLVKGTGGNDAFTIGSGNKILFSSGGSDVAVFSGRLSDYTFSGNTITDIRAGSPNGITVLNDISTAQFSDITTTFQMINGNIILDYAFDDSSQTLNLDTVNVLTVGDENRIVYGDIIHSFTLQNYVGAPSLQDDHFAFGNNTITVGNGNNTIYGDVASLRVGLIGEDADAIFDNETVSIPFTYSDITFTSGGNTIVAGDGNNKLYGNGLEFYWVEGGGAATAEGKNSSASTTFTNEGGNSITYNSNSLTAGNGDNTLIGNVGNFRYQQYGGYASSLGLFSDASTVIHSIEKNTILFNGNSLTAGYGNDVLIGHVQNFSVSLLGGFLQRGDSYDARAQIFSFFSVTFNGNTLSTRVGIPGGTHSPNGVKLYGDVQTFSINGNMSDYNSIIYGNVNVQFGNDTLTAGNDTTNAGTAAPDILVGDVDYMTGYATVVSEKITFGNDILNAGNRNSTLIGDLRTFNGYMRTGSALTMGSDILNGSSGADTMYGDMQDFSPFSTLLQGTQYSFSKLTLGNNTLVAGTGNNTMWGAGQNLASLPASRVVLGSNTFVFNLNPGGMGQNIIGDFNTLKDVLVFQGATNVINVNSKITSFAHSDPVHPSTATDFLKANFINGGSITFNNILYSSLSAAQITAHQLQNFMNAANVNPGNLNFDAQDLSAATFIYASSLPTFDLSTINGARIGGINGTGNTFTFNSMNVTGTGILYGNILNFTLTAGADSRIASYGTVGLGHGNIFNFASNTITAGNGNDIVYGNIGTATLAVSGTASYMFTNSFNFAENTIRVGNGIDTVYGNIGTFAWTVSNGGIVGQYDTNTLAFGANTITIGDGNNAAYGNMGTLILTSGATGQASFSKLDNTSFNFIGNTLTTGNGNDTLVGGVGTLTLAVRGGTAGTGVDAHGEMISNTLTFGNNTLTGGTGNDVLVGDIQTFSFTATPGTGTGNVAALASNNKITFKNNKLYGGAGNDTLYGNMVNMSQLTAFLAASATNTVTLGDNLLVAGPGNDTLWGAGPNLAPLLGGGQVTAGHNTFVFDLKTGGMGIDKLGNIIMGNDTLFFQGVNGIDGVNTKITSFTNDGGAVKVNFTNGGSLTFSIIPFSTLTAAQIATPKMSSIGGTDFNVNPNYVVANNQTISNRVFNYSEDFLDTVGTYLDGVFRLEATGAGRIGGVNGPGNTFNFESTNGAGATWLSSHEVGNFFGWDAASYYGNFDKFELVVGANSRIAAFGTVGLGHGNIFNFDSNHLDGQGYMAGNFNTANLSVSGASSFMYTNSFNFEGNTVYDNDSGFARLSGNPGPTPAILYDSNLVAGNALSFNWTASNGGTVGSFDTNTLTFDGNIVHVANGWDTVSGNIGALSLTSGSPTQTLGSIFNNTSFNFGSNEVKGGSMDALILYNIQGSGAGLGQIDTYLIGNIGTLHLTTDGGNASAQMNNNTFTFSGDSISNDNGNYVLIGDVKHFAFTVANGGVAHNNTLIFGHDTLYGATSPQYSGINADKMYGDILDLQDLIYSHGANGFINGINGFLTDPTNHVILGGNTFVANVGTNSMWGVGGIMSAITPYIGTQVTINPNTFVFNLAPGGMYANAINDFSKPQDILEFHGVAQTFGTTAAQEVQNVNALISGIVNNTGHVEVLFTNGGKLDFNNIAYAGQTSIGQLVSNISHIHASLL